jgi:hypothetical protein
MTPQNKPGLKRVKVQSVASRATLNDNLNVHSISTSFKSTFRIQVSTTAD